MKKINIAIFFVIVLAVMVSLPKFSFAANKWMDPINVTSKDGECGTGRADTGIPAPYSASKPTENLCKVGTVVTDAAGPVITKSKFSTDSTEHWQWMCNGINGGHVSSMCHIPASADSNSKNPPKDPTGKEGSSGVSSKGPGLVPSCPNGACGFNDLMIMINNIIKFIIIDIATPIAAIVFIYAGILLIFSGGDSGKITKAKAMIKNLVIGFIIVLAAWLIVNTILSTLGVSGSFLTSTKY